MVAQLIIVGHGAGPAELDDGKHAVEINLVSVAAVFRLPEGMLLRAEYISRVGECRHPPSVDQSRIPTGMVDVKMGAHGIVDVFHGETGGGQGVR